jgi:diaminopimelate epimerase
MVVGDRDASGAAQVRVEMGEVTFPRGLPFVRTDAAPDGWLSLGDGIRCVPVSVGNPHAVVFGGPWDDPSFHRLGPWIATHPDFPEGTNVQFVGAVEGRVVPIRIWERGVGPTASSGTSACAAAAAAVRTGRLSPGPVEVRMEGGSFGVTVGDDWRVVLEGPVEPVCTGRLEPALIRAGQGGA